LQAKELQAGNVVVTDGLPTANTEPGVDSRPDGAAAQNLMDTIVSKLQAPPEAESSYGVAILLAAGYSGAPVYRAGETAGVVTSQIPAKLVSKVNALQKKGKSAASFTFAKMGSPSALGTLVPGLVYGVPVGPYYQLYYFFPLTQVQQSLDQIQRTLLVAGVVLVFLFAAIAALVTRWVVTPVRHAARGAQRLSTGNLDERMPVRGVDELAALATSFNEMAASLQEKMTALEDLSQVQRVFVSDVSHELRTPLTTIKIAADVLFANREQLAGPVSRSAELLQSQLERFESLLTDLLEISRYDANVAVLDAEPVDICDLARLSADVNAVEHGEGKDAVVTVAGDSAAVAVAVRDYGIGLAAGEEHLVFDRFWRADPARARTIGGTGLGLAIALEDARLHGGWLEAWGEVGRGSVFRLTLPRTIGAELAGSPLPLAPDEADGPTATLADTDTDTAAALTVGVSANGAVPPGASGADGLAAAQPDAGSPAAPEAADGDGVGPVGTPAGAPGQPHAGSRIR
jgi:two-component system sensor histidine kinase MtrB